MKIPNSEIPDIARRRALGETYAAIAYSYGVTPWTIQKRLRHYKEGRLISAPTIKSLAQRRWRAKRRKDNESK